jgi:hypothetical protein
LAGDIRIALFSMLPFTNTRQTDTNTQKQEQEHALAVIFLKTNNFAGDSPNSNQVF